MDADDRTKVDDENTKEKESMGFLEDGNTRFLSYIPLFAISCISIENTDLIAVGGGGGNSETGIKNKILILELDLRHYTLKTLSSFDTGKCCVKCLSFFRKVMPNNEGETFLAAGLDGSCHIYRWTEPRLSHLLSFQTDFSEPLDQRELKMISFNENGSRLVTGGSDGIVRIWKMEEMEHECEQEIQELISPVQVGESMQKVDSIDLHPFGRYLVISSGIFFSLWDTSTDRYQCIKKEHLKELYSKTNLIFRGVKFSRCGNYLFAGKIAPRKRSWLTKWKLIFSDADRKQPKSTIKESFENKTIENWKLVKSTVSHRTFHHNVICISSDGTLLGTGTSEGYVAVFQCSNLKKIMEVKAHNFFVSNVSFNSDSTTILSVSADYSCRCTKVNLRKKEWQWTALWIVSLIILLASIFYSLQEVRSVT